MVINADAEIDRLNSSLFAELIANVAADPATVTRVLPLTSVSRYLERIGDHVKNLAEEVIFMVSATDVRHLGRSSFQLRSGRRRHFHDDIKPTSGDCNDDPEIALCRRPGRA